MANVSQRVSFSILFLSDGPQDQAHPSHRYPKPDRNLIQQQEACATAEKEIKIAGVQLRQSGQEILLAEYQQPRPVELLQLLAGPQP